jgi:4-hydroxy-tetrahydrodipicolinate reductase
VNAAPASPVRTVIVGASGRMGAQLLRLIGEFPALALHGAVASEHSRALGEDASLRAGASPGGVRITAALTPLLQQADLVIDFSPPAAVANHLHACVAARVPMLIGTTALPRELEATFTAAAKDIALLVAPNTSLGVNVLLELVQQAARNLPSGYDIQIVETHHRGKRDAPSGTALALSAAAAAGRGATSVGMSSVRGGDVVGEHEVWFLGEGERVLLKHSATDRAVFARGALLAGQWLAGQAAGRYAMRDVFISNNNNL